jgi:uncharacterized protein (DUF2249 family)
MKISAETKISEIIRMNPDSIDVIATINKNFNKLKNPILRKLLASRVSVSDAAKIGGTTADIILDRLSSIGFEVERSTDPESNIRVGKEFSTTNFKIIELDVRETLKNGIDPFKDIMKTANTLFDNEALKVINTFEPIPLIKILEEKGFKAKVTRKGQDIVETLFVKKNKPGKFLEKDFTVFENKEEFDLLLKKFGDKIKLTDVRDLEMPLPMVAILEALENLAEGFALYVHHKRIPQFLLGELEKRSYVLVSKTLDEYNVDLIIYKK